MKYYPVFLDLKNRICLVIGGGKVAERKVRMLLECGARVRVVARDLTEWLKEQVKSGSVEFVGEDFAPVQIEGTRLVIAATSDGELNRKVAAEADRRGIWCNVVDQPRDCTFILPSVVRRGDLTIAISTSGKSPALARKIRRELERVFGNEYAVFADIMGCIRKKVLERYGDEEKRRKIFASLVESNMVELIKNGKWKEIDSFLSEILGDDFSLKNLGYRKEEGNGS